MVGAEIARVTVGVREVVGVEVRCEGDGGKYFALEWVVLPLLPFQAVARLLVAALVVFIVQACAHRVHPVQRLLR